MPYIYVVAKDLTPLEPLLCAYASDGWGVQAVRGDVPAHEHLREIAEVADALLIVGDRRRAPRSVLPGPVIYRADGSAIPAGWLPNIGSHAVEKFAITAARLHVRNRSTQRIAVLAQWHPQYLRLARRINTLLEQTGASPFQWTSDLVFREDMVQGLRAGLAAAVYVGHGRPIGWVGYYGTRIHHLQSDGEPLGALLSLCCLTASRKRTGLSFSEAVPLNGIAGAAFGAISSTKHLDNTRWAVGLCAALREGVSTIGEWIVRALPPGTSAGAAYRLLGDPLAPLAAAASAHEQADAVPIYA